MLIFSYRATMSTADGYGHEYTSSSLPSYSAPAPSSLAGHGIRFVRLTWVDLANATRFRVISLAHFLRILAAPRPAISLIRATPAIVFNSTTPGSSSVGEVVYTPDLTSLRVTSYAPGHALLFGWFEEKALHEGRVVSAPTCPRNLLRRVIE
jgi:glutamine synthetase